MKRKGFLLFESVITLSLICLGGLCFNQIYQQTTQLHRQRLQQVTLAQQAMEQAQAARYRCQLPKKVGEHAATITW